MKLNNEKFVETYNDIENYPSIMSVAEALGVSYNEVKNKAEAFRRASLRGGAVDPLVSRTHKSVAESRRLRLVEEMDDALRATGKDKLTKSHFKALKPEVSELDIESEFGTYGELARAAGHEPTRGARQVVLNVARHASQDHFTPISEGRKGFGDVYRAPSGGRWKTILGANDLHDKECDPFWLSVFIDTAKRVQPDVIVLNGDVFDLAEFGKYSVDPRNWDIVGSIKFVHEQILAPLRAACPSAQIDIIEGNHEYRLCRFMAEAAPAMRALLSDLHGWDIARLLGLHEYGVNYVAKGNLKSFTKSDAKKEVARNYRIYFDTVMANHYPDARSMGMPGWNGHHHSHHSYQMFNPKFGAYEWHQFGCGHHRDADYCAGEKWGMGFGLIHIDTHKHMTNFDYIPVTDMAIVGGQWYHRPN